MNGASGGAWGRSNEHGKENPPGPDVCWDREGTMQPLGLSEMTEEEKEVSACLPTIFSGLFLDFQCH